ncbi:unnamed protein product [Soboliphyme baturini]|uniref:receptor protein serine/threonine kinase n=1 Tax=Soboliphyme baturini TaxID=241478 RepID=A0A183IQL7_9BILA|nr:unnamed protein product [Soboliphyme baturini]
MAFDLVYIPFVLDSMRIQDIKKWYGDVITMIATATLKLHKGTCRFKIEVGVRPEMRLHLNKQSIAHRDIKSSNVLVRNDMSCVIGDFGYSVKMDSLASSKFIIEQQIGTRRYMPPEVINRTINHRDFNALKLADIYSVALVYWEIINRTGNTGDDPKKADIRVSISLQSNNVVCYKSLGTIALYNTGSFQMTLDKILSAFS